MMAAKTHTQSEQKERDRRRAAVIARFKARQRAQARWVELRQLAEWYQCRNTARATTANEDNTIGRARRKVASAIANGEFDRQGRTQVLLLSCYAPIRRLTRQIFADASQVQGLDLWEEYLDCSWIPAGMARWWLDEHLGRPSQSASIQPVPQAGVPNVRRRRPHTGLDYREADGPLIEEMRLMIDGGKATSAEHAARFVVHRALGRATDENKVKRLSKHFREGT